MSHSCFNASAFALATNVFLTLHRLEFPANVRVFAEFGFRSVSLEFSTM